MFVVVLRFFKSLHVSFNKNNIYKVLGFTIMMMILASLGYYHYESPGAEDLSLGDALWWSFVTLTTVGYGDFFPITFGGRIIAIVLMISGIGTFGFMTAAVASIFVENALREGMGLMSITDKNHIVIIGWNKKAQTILKEILNEKLEDSIVVIAKEERLDLPGKNMYFVHGDAGEDEILEKANIREAKLVMVLADEEIGDEKMADARSVLICLAVDQMNPNVHLVAEVLDESNLPHFKRANVNDTIVTSQMSSKMIVRGALYKHVSSAMKELLTNDYGNEIYERKASSHEIGKHFEDLAKEYIMESKGIIIGIASQQGMKVNPSKEYIIKQDDIIVYIGEEKN